MKNKKIKKIILLLTIILNLTILPTTLAQTNNKVEQPKIIPQTNNNKQLLIPHNQEQGHTSLIEETFPVITTTLIVLTGSLSFLFIIIAGIQILTAYGDDEKLGTAKKTITYAIIGLLISILAYAIVSMLSSVKIGTQEQNTTQQNQPQLAPGTGDGGGDKGDYEPTGPYA